ncbi:TetR family transcriptional regulator [Rhodospirillaceae bacterium SYSU D60014]|uniref:TetR family transcriptional regulator n=1 Tax=Virgifigura deserti TaxID=2268457 RepID=UPI000E674423
MNRPAVPAPAEDLPSSPRRAPVQRRSRERVERMLTAAATLIAEGGSDAMRMSDVAEMAGVSIGSLYQYFPDKGAIIRTLAERYNAQGRACIAAALADVRDMDGLREAFAGLIDTYYAMFLAEPVMRDIWSGTQADKALRDIDLADSRANGAVLAEVLARLRPSADPAALATSAFLTMQLGEATVRLAISVDRAEGDALIAAFKRMVLRELCPDEERARGRSRAPDC